MAIATYKKIASVTVTGATAAAMEFTNIPNTYTDLILKISARTTRTNYNYSELVIQVNNITSTSNYTAMILLGNNGSAAGFQTTTYAQASYVSTDKTTSGIFGSVEMYIPNYTSSNKKSMLVDGAAEVNGTDNAMTLNAILSNDTTTINYIKLFPATNEGVNFTQHSTATLYGIVNSN